MQKITRALVVTSLVLGVSGCWEMGHDPEGPNKAFLKLQRANGEVSDFYLGGYGTLEKCLDLLQYEVEAVAERGGKFFTNKELTYGGYESADLIVEHSVIGATCLSE